MKYCRIILDVTFEYQFEVMKEKANVLMAWGNEIFL